MPIPWGRSMVAAGAPAVDNLLEQADSWGFSDSKFPDPRFPDPKDETI